MTESVRPKWSTFKGFFNMVPVMKGIHEADQVYAMSDNRLTSHTALLQCSTVCHGFPNDRQGAHRGGREIGRTFFTKGPPLL